jgi:transglutaminase-like putative cysteine protease
VTAVRRAWWAWLVVVVALRGAVAAGGPWTLDQEHWYVVELTGAPAGSMSVRRESDESRYRTATEMTLRIARGPVEITIDMSSSFVETRDGKPVTLHLVQDMGLQRVETEYRFEADHVVETTRQADRQTSSVEPLPSGDWLTPEAARRYWMDRVKAGDTTIEYRTVDGQTGLDAIDVHEKLTGRETADVGGRRLPVTVWETLTSVMPVKGISKYDGDGNLVYEETNAGLGSMVLRLVSKDEALAARRGPAPELLVETFVEPVGHIPRVGRATTATLRLRARQGELPDLPSAGAQRVTRADDGSALLSIDVDASSPADAADAGDPMYLESSAMVNAKDPEIGRLAAQALEGAGDDPADRAEALRRAVGDLIVQKGLDTAFATASETARTRRGDCSEHAVLLCAMLRAAGIPARVAIGLIYADSFMGHEDIFGWHMWTQAIINGRWVDLDATLSRRFHAGHVLAATSALHQGGLDAELASTLMLIGNLRIEVVDVGYAAAPAQPAEPPAGNH